MVKKMLMHLMMHSLCVFSFENICVWLLDSRTRKLLGKNFKAGLVANRILLTVIIFSLEVEFEHNPWILFIQDVNVQIVYSKQAYCIHGTIESLDF